MKLSVIIPTRDRPAHLAETLQALATQGRDDFEVLVVDDGSQESQRSWLASPPVLPYTLRILRQDRLGPAAARNRGVAQARGERVLFLGDDTRPAPGCLERHLALAGASHVSSPVAIQGRIDWDPQHEITPLMAFLAPAGPQFYFKGLEHGQPIPFTAVLGSNCSVPTQWLREEPFDPAFATAALEDTEAAFRWQRRGWVCLFAADAVAWHHHHYDDLEVFLDRQRRAGAAAALAIRKHRALWWYLVGRLRLWGAWMRCRAWLGRGRPTDGWDLACRRAFLEGYRAFRRDRLEADR